MIVSEITVGTTNDAKVQQVRGALSALEITVNGIDNPELLPEVIETGKTTLENARAKVIAFASVLGKTVLSMDNALYLDGLSGDLQPGLNVRRIPGSSERPTDEQLLTYFSRVINQLGGKTTGRWEFGVCVANPYGILGETKITSDREFTSKVGERVIPGYPLDSLQIDPVSGKYISDMNGQEQAEFWQRDIGKKLCDFVVSIGLSSVKK